MNLYLTADEVGIPTGGGLVTKQELQALRELGPCKVISREELGNQQDPWGWDEKALELLKLQSCTFELCHIYSGTFSKAAEWLKNRWGCRISWTVAAHDRHVSKREHEKLGLQFNYPHLVDEGLWKNYIRGYQLADVIVAPSTVAKRTIEAYGGCDRIEVIPHGCDIPGSLEPLPARFSVGYIGAYGADKGVVYLLQAWNKLKYQDATLVLAGSESTSDFVASHLVPKYGGGSIQLMGWQKDASKFYNRISVLVQPSCSEGFGLTVLEAMSYGRPVLCSLGAGASDVVPEMCRFEACGVEAIVEKIETLRSYYPSISIQGWQDKAKPYEWSSIRESYKNLWKSMMS